MSKKKQLKKYKALTALQSRQFDSLVNVTYGKLDEIIDLLHVLVLQTKPPEPPKRELDFNITIPENARTAQREWEQQMQADLQRYLPGDRRTPGKKPTTIAREEVEDYHGIATTEPYSVPVRIHR